MVDLYLVRKEKMEKVQDWMESCKDRLDPELVASLRQTAAVPGSGGSDSGTHHVLISLRDPSKSEHVEQLCKIRSTDTITPLASLGMFSGNLCVQTIRTLAELPEVLFISADKKVSLLLNHAVQAVEASAVHSAFGLTGRGVGIAILDTGVYPHPDLTLPVNRYITFVDFINYRTDPYDDNGHGTHVAGCAASNGYASGGLYRGPAPEANIIGIKVLNAQGEGTYSTILAGIDFCIRNRQQLNIRVMNLSLGAVPSVTHVNDPLAMACRIAWRSGIVVCAAAGNTGPTGTIHTPGYEPLVLTVGAIDDANTASRSDDRYSDYTSRGPTVDGFIKPDIAAPGTGITSLLSPNSALAIQYAGNLVGEWYLTLTGTSMATPICAGAAAQILQAYPVFTPDQVKVLLKETAQYFQANVPGYMQVSRAVQLPAQ